MCEQLLTVSNRNAKTMFQALQCALLTLSQCVVYSENGQNLCFIHSRNTARSKAIQRYKNRQFNLTQYTKVLDVMQGCGFVQCVNGHRGKGFDKGLATLWLVEPLFNEWLSENIQTLTVTRFESKPELIELRAIEKDQKHIDYVDDDLTNSMRQRVTESNQLRLNHQWSFQPLDKALVDGMTMKKGKPKKIYRHYLEGDERLLISPESLVCHRVFKGDFKSGGRFYCAAQSLQKDERATIQIDQEPTLEIDLKSLHPRLLYNLKGLPAPEDCYQASSTEQRDLNKMICMYLINSDSKKKAVTAIRKVYGLGTEDAETYVQDFLNMHPLIADDFFKSGWKTLQFIDSQLVDSVLACGVEKNIPILPVHDSFIVKTRDAHWLLATVKTVYKELIGFEPVVTY